MIENYKLSVKAEDNQEKFDSEQVKRDEVFLNSLIELALSLRKLFGGLKPEACSKTLAQYLYKHQVVANKLDMLKELLIGVENNKGHNGQSMNLDFFKSDNRERQTRVAYFYKTAKEAIGWVEEALKFSGKKTPSKHLKKWIN